MSSTKRKSDVSTSASAKKTRMAHTAAIESVRSILADTSNFEVPESADGTRRVLLELAQYARSLEEQVVASKPKEKTLEEVKAAAKKLCTAARSGIQKQMTWKPSCKTSSAKWTYDGVCADPDVFGALLGLDGPPNFKSKKISKEEFVDLIGDLKASVRYASLYLSSDVNIQWKPAEGTFKFSGSYGK